MFLFRNNKFEKAKMHVIKARREPGAAAASKPITTGSGLDQLVQINAASENKAPSSSAPGSKRASVPPPSTRQFANNYAAFYGEN